MNRETEKMIKLIQQLIEEKGLTSEKEINDFIQNEMIGRTIDDFDFEANATDEEIAIDMVYQAMDKDDDYEAISLLGEALILDKKNIDAYSFLATKQIHPFLSEYFLKKAIKIGKKKFSKEFLEENKEHLWTIHETRPFLRAMSQLAHVNYSQGYEYACAKILAKTIDICPNDNLGNRNMLFTLLLDLKKFKKYNEYVALFEDDIMASTLFSKVYYSYYKDNDLEKTLYLLKAAQQSNLHVVKKLINPNVKLKLAENFTIGSTEEANNYCFFAKEMWEDDAELIHWLKQNQ
jgi:hypothetical protein